MRLGFLAIAFALACSAVSAADLKIPQGALHGDTTEGVASFKNIPYAAPPVGALRWRAPQPAPGWEGTRQAVNFGPICPQNRRPSIFMPKLPQSEDCLTLNVWTPKAEPGAKLPVMVWIYGGGFLEGGAAVPIYDGIDLAKHGVVVVSLNYRLGLLGFFNHPALKTEGRDESGNFGLLDQIAALQWVQQNIAHFGGDPHLVTIFGESAGGVSVNDLVASPLARGLFLRAISESGLGLLPTQTADEAQKNSVASATKLGVAGADTAALAKLRKLSVAQILKPQGDLSTEGHVQPYIDGKVIPEDVSVRFAKGEIAKVDYLAGSNSNEASLAPALGLDPVQGLSKFGDQLPNVRAIYEANGALSDAEFGRQAFGDSLFTSGAQDFAAFVAKAGGRSHVYHFAYVADTYKGKVLGVSHGGEIVYVFGLRGLGFLAGRASDKDKQVIALTQDYWTNFAKTGDPNGAGLPAWPAFTPADRETLVFDDETKAKANFRRGQVGVMEIGWSRRTGLSAP
ncbi:MAG: carboxylesterase family protein [Alphaproteobacteria bacterium]|nr:carboxylesterase family protein [Alphaproteobacteria bacterium]